MSVKTTAKSTMALRKGTAAPVILEMCSVRVGPTLFGVPITHILEIIGNAHPQAVPLAPDFVGGLVHYRGDVLTTVSLRQLLGLPEMDTPGKDGKQAPDGQASNRRRDILVLECTGGCFGLLVDSVGEVLTVSSADHEPNPSTLEGRRSALFAGTYKLSQGLLVMLDPERLNPEALDFMRLEATTAA
jgi:purine-binding chemotaxis protein CheW